MPKLQFKRENTFSDDIYKHEDFDEYSSPVVKYECPYCRAENEFELSDSPPMTVEKSKLNSFYTSTCDSCKNPCNMLVDDGDLNGVEEESFETRSHRGSTIIRLFTYDREYFDNTLASVLEEKREVYLNSGENPDNSIHHLIKAPYVFLPITWGVPLLLMISVFTYSMAAGNAIVFVAMTVLFLFVMLPIYMFLEPTEHQKAYLVGQAENSGGLASLYIRFHQYTNQKFR